MDEVVIAIGLLGLFFVAVFLLFMWFDKGPESHGG